MIDKNFDSEHERKQIDLEKKIQKHLNELYEMLRLSDRIEAEGALGYVAQAKAEWEDGDGSPA